MKFAALLCLVAGLTVTGCAANVHKNAIDGNALNIAPDQSKRIVMRVTGSAPSLSSPDWERLGREWRKAVGIVGGRTGIDYALQNNAEASAPPDPNGPPGVLAIVDVKKFRFVAPGARYGFGVMTGNAYLQTQVQFADLRTGAPLGTRSYDTSSTAWEGIFSATTDRQVEAVCQEIATEVTRH